MQTWIVVPKVGEPFEVKTDDKNSRISLVAARECGTEAYYKIGYAEVAVFRASEIVGIYEKVEEPKEDAE